MIIYEKKNIKKLSLQYEVERTLQLYISQILTYVNGVYLNSLMYWQFRVRFAFFMLSCCRIFLEKEVNVMKDPMISKLTENNSELWLTKLWNNNPWKCWTQKTWIGTEINEIIISRKHATCTTWRNSHNWTVEEIDYIKDNKTEKK